jgi:hypothetical protein
MYGATTGARRVVGASFSCRKAIRSEKDAAARGGIRSRLDHAQPMGQCARCQQSSGFELGGARVNVLSHLSDWSRTPRPTATGDSYQESHRQPPKGDKHSRDAWQREMERAQVAHWFQGPIVGSTASAGIDRFFKAPQPGAVLPPTLGSVNEHGGYVTSGTSIPPLENSPAAKAQGNRLSFSSNCEITASTDRRQSTAKLPSPWSELESEQLAHEDPPSSAAEMHLFAAELEKISGLTLVLVPDHAALTAAPVTPTVPKMLVTGYAGRSRMVNPQDVTQTADCSHSSDDSATRLHAQWQDDNVTVWLGVNGDRQGIEQRVAILATSLRRCIAARGNRLVKLVCNGRTIYELDYSHARANSHYLSIQMATTVHIERVVYESAEQYSSVNHLTNPKETL